MDDLRVILLIAGVLLIVGIYAWDRLRRARRQRQRAREQTQGYVAPAGGSAQDRYVMHDVLLADTDHLDDEAFDLGLDDVSGVQREHALGDAALADFASHSLDPSLDDAFEDVLDDDYLPMQYRQDGARHAEATAAASAVYDEDAFGHALDQDLEDTFDPLLVQMNDLRIDEADLDATAPAVQLADTAKTAESEAAQIADKLDEGLIQILVTAHKGQRFTGEALLQAAGAAGLEHGAMRIFHSKVEGGGVFSMANLVEPGWFDPATMDDGFTTPGVCLFMPLAGGGDPLKTFDAMLMAAGILAERLDAELRDETSSRLSRQTATHMREQVTQYRLRKQMEKNAAEKHRGGRRR